MSRRPLILITATTRRESPDDPLRVRLNGAYVEAVTRAGGIAVVAPPQPLDAAEALLERAEGLLLTGGEDVDPALYGAAPHRALGRVTGDRDAWELELVRGARRRGMPTLAICRGIQVLNVALGGTLIQDIPDERPSAIRHEQEAGRAARTHPLRLVAGSRLATLFGTEADVNSMHHQAVGRVAPGLRVTALAPDGIVEGVETDDGWWALGVQWHPEELDGADSRLFAALVAEATSQPRRQR